MKLIKELTDIASKNRDPVNKRKILILGALYILNVGKKKEEEKVNPKDKSGNGKGVLFYNTLFA